MLFSSRRVMEGQYAGRHASPQRGHSVEFSDYREYVPGDEMGDVDWKVYGRSDKLFIKLFEHQSDMAVNLLVDASASMGFAGIDQPRRLGRSWLGDVRHKVRSRSQRDQDNNKAEPRSKYDHACCMAGAIAFLTVGQQDRVGFAAAKQGLNHFVRPRGSFMHLNTVLAEMEKVDPTGPADLAGAITALSQRLNRRGLLIVFSDLLEQPEPILKALSALTQRGSEIIVFQVLHEQELQLPAVTEAMFRDSETNKQVRLNVDDIRQEYQRRLKQHQRTWAAALRARQIDHNVVSTAVPYQRALERYLFSRASKG